MKRTLALFLALTLSLSLLAGCGGQEAQSTPAPIGTTAPTATPDAEEPTTKVVVDPLACGAGRGGQPLQQRADPRLRRH